DSTAEAVGSGLVQWAAENPTVAKVTVLAGPGCGFIRSGTVLADPDMVESVAAFAASCQKQLDVLLPKALNKLHPDVVLLMNSINDVLPRVFDPAVGYLTPLDHDFLTRAYPDYLAIEEYILDHSDAHVAWIRPPEINPFWVDREMPARDPAAHASIEHVMATVAAVHPERAVVLDLRAWMEQVGVADDPAYRPDGIHEDATSALDLVTRFLGPELVTEATRAG
ncbi:MAG: putative acyltransferase, partial [Ilumatobacteraceae bacterium]|nr:putative acyltransferase [Ilumatobacteraceae bacterium]